MLNTHPNDILYETIFLFTRRYHALGSITGRSISTYLVLRDDLAAEGYPVPGKDRFIFVVVAASLCRLRNKIETIGADVGSIDERLKVLAATHGRSIEELWEHEAGWVAADYLQRCYACGIGGDEPPIEVPSESESGV